MYTVISRSLACSYVQIATGIVGLFVCFYSFYSAAVSGTDGTADNGTVSSQPHSHSADKGTIVGLA